MTKKINEWTIDGVYTDAVTIRGPFPLQEGGRLDRISIRSDGVLNHIQIRELIVVLNETLDIMAAE